METLPCELLNEIYQKLNLRELGRCLRVCKFWKDYLIEEESVDLHQDLIIPDLEILLP